VEEQIGPRLGLDESEAFVSFFLDCALRHLNQSPKRSFAAPLDDWVGTLPVGILAVDACRANTRQGPGKNPWNFEDPTPVGPNDSVLLTQAARLD
jgi:hypothetical protein